MKKILILLTFSCISYLSNAQTDTSTKTSDSIMINENKLSPTDSILNQTDTTNYALLYVYRPKNFSGSAMSYDLKITNALFSDHPIGRVKNNSKFIVKLYQEGKTQLFAQTESKRAVLIDVKFGKKYYLKCGITIGVLVGRPELNLIYPEQGELDFENVEGIPQ